MRFSNQQFFAAGGALLRAWAGGVHVQWVAVAQGRAGPREGLKFHPQICDARLGGHSITALDSSSSLLAKADFL